MENNSNFRRKAFFGLAISICLVGAVAALLLISHYIINGGSSDGERSTDAPDGASPAAAVAGKAAPPAAEPGAAEGGETEKAAAAAAEPERRPLLKGRVTGEDGGIAGARVMLFSVREVEAFLRRFEGFDPGSGLPDIPAIIAAVREELERFKKTARIATSNPQGDYAFYEAAASGNFVLALAPGYVFRYGDVVCLAPDRVEELNLFLNRGARISGKVVAANENGIPGTAVTAVYSPPGMNGMGKIVQKLLRYVNGEFLKGPFQSRTDEEGNFVIDSLPPGVYELVAEKAGFPESRLVAIPTGTTEAVLLLQAGVAVRGILVDGAGLPVPGINIRLAAQSQDVLFPFPGMGDIAGAVSRLIDDPPPVAVSGERGAFRFENIPPGRHTLEIQQAGYLPFRRQLDIPAGKTFEAGVVKIDAGAGISGWVKNAAGVAIAGASVSAFAEGQTFFTMGGSINDMMSGRNTASSDGAGHFQLDGLAPGNYRLIAQARGHGGASRGKTPAGGDPLILTLEPGVTIRGKVTDAATGEAIPGARVSASGVQAQTDADGRFVLEGVAPRSDKLNPFQGMSGGPGFRVSQRRRGGETAGAEGEETARKAQIRVKAAKESYQDGIATIDPAEAGQEAAIALSKKPRIHGVVKDARGNPLPAALARLIPGDSGMPDFLKDGWVFADTAVSNLEGQFTLDASEQEGSFAVLVSHPLHASRTTEAFQPSEHGEDNPIEVVLPAGGTVRGQVTDGSRGISGARLLLSKARKEDARMAMFSGMFGLPKEGQTGYTSSAGAFLYERVQAGTYVLSAENPGFRDSKSESFTLADGEVKDLTLAMDPGGTIAGTVSDPLDQPIAGARVRVLAAAGPDDEMAAAQRYLGGGLKTAVTDASGVFQLDGLPHGAYTVIAGKQGYTDAEAAEAKTENRNPVRLILVPEARLRGQVSDLATGAPLPRYELRISPADGAGPTIKGGLPIGYHPWQEVRESEGRFFENGLAAGEYRVEVRAAQYAPETRTLSLQPGSDGEVRFALARAGRVTGIVADSATGLPVSGARIGLAIPPPPPSGEEDSEKDAAAAPDPRKDLEEVFSEMASGQSSPTADDGSFLIDSFPAEPRSVLVSHDEYLPERTDAMSIGMGEQKELKLLLRKGLSISGWLRSASGATVTGGFLVIRGTEEGNRSLRKSTSCDASGAFRFAGLAPGRYIIIVPGRRGRGDPSTFPAAIEAESITGLEIRQPAE